MHFALCLLINCISFVLFQLYIESSLGLEVAYNNESIGVWEPLIEPVLDTKGEYHKWSIGLEVSLQSKWMIKAVCDSTPWSNLDLDVFEIRSRHAFVISSSDDLIFFFAFSARNYGSLFKTLGLLPKKLIWIYI